MGKSYLTVFYGATGTSVLLYGDVIVIVMYCNCCVIMAAWSLRQISMEMDNKVHLYIPITKINKIYLPS